MNEASSQSKHILLKVFLIFFFLVAILLSVGFFLFKVRPSESLTPISSQASEESKANRILAEKTDRPFLGNPNAKVVIVEFSDFQCPNSRNEFFTIREIANKYKDKILFIYRQFPSIDENSFYLSLVSLCANEQGKFWPWHDKMFLSPDKQTDSAFLTSINQQLGINQEQLDACVTGKKYESRFLEDVGDAYQLGVKGTPTFFINGTKIAGVVSLADWEKIINKALEINL
ncbi:MAG: thioredoxin domain-containing protein [Patescibacteria group bacterium]